MNGFIFRVLLAISLSIVTLVASADEELPLWELGLGVAAVSQPHYFGAADSRAYVLPIPYFKYRGDVFRADRGGIRARLFESDRVSLGISGGGSFPVDSEDDDARRGMPDLDVLAEIGPNLRVDLVENEDLHLQFQLPIRGTFSFGDDNGDYQGWTSNPRLVAKMSSGEWDFTSSFGPIFSDQKYHAYTYDVAPEFVTAERGAYTASSGYTALRLGLNVDRYYRNMVIAGFVRYFNMQGAKNDASPLFRRDHNFSAGITVSWILKRSKRTVRVSDDDLE
ncbi:MAG: MipA/OmpV family protein [Pseudomonadales bacterium]